MIIDLQKLEEVKYQFSELGRTVADVSTKTDENAEIALNSMKKMQEAMFSAVDFKQLSQVSDAANSIADYVDEFSNVIDSLTKSFAGFDDFSDSVNIASDKFAKVAKDLDELYNKKASVQTVGAPEREARKSKRKMPTVLKKEISGVKGKVNALLRTLRVPKPGTIMAGAIGLMAYGAAEEQRIIAESAEVKNILINTYDGLSKDIISKGTKYVSSFQEHLQKSYGIAKGEVQSVAKAFAEGGITIAEMMGGFDKQLGEVGKTYLSFSLGVDKMLELAGGTTAKKMTDYAAKYGMDLKDSKDTIMRMVDLGQQSQVGVLQFMKNIETTSDSLSKLGFSMETVIDMTVTMQNSFEKLGVPKQFAGKQAAQGMQQMAQGLAQMSDGWKAFLGEKLGYGKGLEAVQKFDERFLELTKGGASTSEDFDKFILTITDAIYEAVGGDEVRARQIMSQDIGMGFQGALNADTLRKAIKAGDREKAEKARTQLQKELKNSLKTEGEKRKAWERHMNEWLKGLSEIGQGLLGLVLEGLASLIAYFKSVPSLFMNMFEGKKGAEANIALKKQISAVAQDSDQHIDRIIGGFDKLSDAGQKLLGDVVGSSMKSLRAAVTFDPLAETEIGLQAKRDRVLPPAQITPPPTVQLVPMSTKAPSIAEIPTEDIYKMQEYGGLSSMFGEGSEKWKGERPLQIVSYGVSEEGNIKMALVGQCPRCALDYDKGFDKSEFEDTKAGIQPSSGVKSRATAEEFAADVGGVPIAGKGLGRGRTESTAIEFGKAGAMEKFREATMSPGIRRKLKKLGKEAPELDPELGKITRMLSKEFGDQRVVVHKTAGAGEKAHGKGEAMDVTVKGADQGEVFKFLRAKGYGKKHGGLGYYPTQSFVHVDVRDKPATWVDVSGRGEESQSPEGGIGQYL